MADSYSSYPFAPNDTSPKTQPKTSPSKKPRENLIIVSIIAGAALLILLITTFFLLSNRAENPDKYISLGQKHLLAAEYEEAIEAFQKAIKADQGNIPARLGLAQAYMPLEQYFNAEIRLLEILDTDPQNSDAYIAMQDLYNASGDYTNLKKTLGIMRQIGLEHSIVYGSLSGTLLDGIHPSGAGEEAKLSEAQVTVKSNGQDIQTLSSGQDGTYYIWLRQNTLTMSIAKTGYTPYEQQIEIRSNEILCMPTISLASAASGQASGPAEGSSGLAYVPITSDFIVTYNFEENGGTASGKASEAITIGKAIDLTPEATRAGWEFVGWNTDKNAETKLTSLTMGPHDMVVYAIYKKTLTATFRDYSGSSPVSRTASVTIYNKATSGDVAVPAQNAYGSGSARGWSASTSAGAGATVSSGNYSISNDTTFYGLYQRSVTLRYNANGGSSTPSSQTGTIYMNSANISAPSSHTFTLAPAITRDGQTFAGWSLGGTQYQAGGSLRTANDVTVYAMWQ